MPLAERGEEADEPMWSAGTLAAHLGVSVVTLRSWSRRYGLDPAGHVSGQHRRYQARDVARFETMRRLIAAGMASADAARWVQTHPPGFTETPPRSGAEGLSSGNSGLLPARDDLVAETNQTRNEDFVAVARAVKALLLAASRLDSDAVAGALDRHLAHRGVVSAWDDICVPVLTQIGERNRDRGDCVDVERVLSWTVSAALQRVPVPAGRLGGRVALLACLAGEQHTLALEALRAALAQRGVSVRMLGAATPTSALLAAIARSHPGAIVVWAQTARTARPSALVQMISDRGQQHFGGPIVETSRPPVVLAGGPGWQHCGLPADVTRVRSLPDALRLSLDAVASPVELLEP
jgi:MerR family transcriptional regulator, light-induced transcriptional regulator